MKVKLFGTVLLCAVLLLSGAACGGAAPAPTPTPTPTPVEMSAEEIVDAALAAGAELDTCQFDMDMEMTAIGGMAPGTMAIHATGAIDEPNRKMHIDMAMLMSMTGLGDMEASMEMYLVGDWVYMRMEMYGEEMWMKTPMTEELWEEQDISSQQLDFLEDFVGVELLGTETVDGIECYKLDVTPDLEKLWDWAQMQGGIEELEPGADLEEIITDLSITEWIATDTYFPVKAVIEMTMTIESETIDMAITITMYDFNEPVTIVLPPEAADAVEVPSFD